jgi:ribonucleoside-diphosphate reductase alpha chain
VGAVAECLTRILDDAIQASIAGLPSRASSSVMAMKRKLGIGICGLSDALLWLGIDYGSDQSARLLADSLATINYRSKLASLALASRRGPFPLFRESAYVRNSSYLLRFAHTDTVVRAADWRNLARRAADLGLRNVMTTALPPSGRSALLLGVNPSIEPPLTLIEEGTYVRPIRALMDAGHVYPGADGLIALLDMDRMWPQSAASSTSLFRTAVDLSEEDHFRILEVAARNVDDGVSKTINLPSDSRPDDVDGVLRRAWSAGLKAISVYRVGSRTLA